jgi:hypothetical protein
MHYNHDPNIMLCRHIAIAQIDATGQIIIAIQAQAIQDDNDDDDDDDDDVFNNLCRRDFLASAILLLSFDNA